MCKKNIGPVADSMTVFKLRIIPIEDKIFNKLALFYAIMTACQTTHHKAQPCWAGFVHNLAFSHFYSTDSDFILDISSSIRYTTLCLIGALSVSFPLRAEYKHHEKLFKRCK